MKKWVMILLVTLVSVATGIGYYYYNYIYRAPEAVESRELMETNAAYDRLIEDARMRVAKNGYTHRVVINPIGGGPETGLTSGTLRESDVVVDIARNVLNLNQNSEIGIFITRDGDTDPTFEQRLKFIEIVDPDMIIELRLDENNDAQKMGTSVYYDDEYYDYHLPNADLADIMEKNTVTAIGGVAVGIFPLEDEASAFVKGSHIPSVVIKCGHITNSKEAEALASGAYRTNLATGILKGISEGYKVMDSESKSE